MTEQERRHCERADTLVDHQGPHGTERISTRSPVTKAPTEQPREPSPNSGRKLIRNMLGTALIGSAIVGGGLYHHFGNGWNPFDTTDKQNSSETNSDDDKDEEEIEVPKGEDGFLEITDSATFEKALRVLEIKAAEADFEECPENRHARYLLLNVNKIGENGELEYEWVPATSRVNVIEHYTYADASNPHEEARIRLQTDYIIAVYVDNDYLVNAGLDFKGYQPVANATLEEDERVRYVLYDPSKKVQKGQLSQIGFKSGNKALGTRSFDIPRIKKVKDDAGITEYVPVE